MGREALKEGVAVSGVFLNILLLPCLASGELEKGLKGGILWQHGAEVEAVCCSLCSAAVE